MKKRKIFMSAVAGGLAALMLAGCSGGTDSGGSTQDVTKLEGTLASAEPLTLTVHMHLSGSGETDEYYAARYGFERFDGLKPGV